MAGVEPAFGLNNFKQPKYYNESETIARSILALLFGRPGYFPSMPNLGIDIQEVLYMFWDDISPENIKARIMVQCSEFSSFIANGTLDVIKSSYKNQPLLLIVLPIINKQKSSVLKIGITTDNKGAIMYNYIFDEEKASL